MIISSNSVFSKTLNCLVQHLTNKQKSYLKCITLDFCWNWLSTGLKLLQLLQDSIFFPQFFVLFIDFFVLPNKVWWTVWISRFCPKLRYFADQNGSKGGQHENEFWLFSNTKLNVTKSLSGKSRWKEWGHLSSFHVFFVSHGP